MLITHH